MAGEGVSAHPVEARVSTGVASLDAMLEGGLVAHRPYLIVGPSGTGKTTLAIQFLCEGIRRNERVLLVTLEEPPNEAHVNHRGLEPTLGRVEVFDAIPDIMRYERTPFKDIASVRTAVPFSQVPPRIRQSPELASVEVTITALEQMLRTEVIRKGYTRLVIDSLTALQYFCMKGFDPVGGAQSLLRFLSDLRVTTLITVESPLEDVETPERMLARGEIRLFRWELDGYTVRAVGVEKFRGSSHDVRLHPYRIGPRGIDINLDVTISRDTRQIIEPIVPRVTVPVAAAPVAPAASPVTPLMDEVRDLILIGADVAPARSEIAAALAATIDGRPDQAQAHLARVSSLVVGLVDQLGRAPGAAVQADPTTQAALQRVLARADSFRAGVPPTSLPPPSVLQVQLGALLSLLPAPATAPPPAAVPAPMPVAVTTEPRPSAEPIAAAAAPVPPLVEPAPPPPSVQAPPSEPVASVEASVEVPAPAPSESPKEVTAEAPPGPPTEVSAPASPEPSREIPAPAAPEPPKEVPAPRPLNPPKSEEPVPSPEMPPVEATSPASVTERAPEAVPVPPETPAPAAAPPPSEAPPAPAPVPVAPVPPPHERAESTPPRAGRRLPAPPSPRPPIGAGPSRPKSEAASGPRTTKAGPPPLPSTSVPEWPVTPAAPARSTGRGHPPSRVPESHPVVTPSPSRPPAGSAAKKRRKGSAAAGARRPAGHVKPVTVVEAEAKPPSPPEVVPAPPTPPTPAVEPAVPEAVPTKVRRRSPRKRKAPPVVSATVEPVPPGALMEPEDDRKSTDDPDAPARPEG